MAFKQLSFAKSLRRHRKDFLPFEVSISVLDGRLRRAAKDARRKWKGLNLAR
jgi:hypothetical protein